MVPPGRQIEGAAQRRCGAGSFKDGVKSISSERTHGVMQVVGAWIQRHVGAELERLIAAGSDGVADRDRDGAKGTHRDGYQQTDGSTSGDEHALACDHARSPDGM